MKKLFVINPTSGGGSAVADLEHHIQSAMTGAETSYAIRNWADADGLPGLLADAGTEFDAVVAVGGDGTVNAIAREILGKGLALGVVPTGSGNGLARHLGMASRIGEACAQIRTARRETIDVGDFGGAIFLNNAGIGVDALIANRFDQSQGAGMATYFRISVQTLLNYPGVDCQLTVDGGPTHDLRNMLIVDVANGPEWGGGAKIAPASRMQDGLLEVILLEKTSYLQLVRLGWQLFQGNIHKHPRYKMIRGKQFEFQRAAPGYAQVDGEPLSLGAQISVSVRENALDVLVPGDSGE